VENTVPKQELATIAEDEDEEQEADENENNESVSDKGLIDWFIHLLVDWWIDWLIGSLITGWFKCTWPPDLFLKGVSLFQVVSIRTKIVFMFLLFYVLNVS
jgi:hypothetical protein